MNGCHAGRSLLLSEETSADEPASAAQTSDAAPGLSAAGNDDPYLLADGLYLTELFPYSGVFVEDGSNAPCEDIAAVTLINNSDVSYQYLKFDLTTAKGVFSFTASTLPGGEQMTVLNERQAAFADAEILSHELITVIPFENMPSVHSDLFQITGTERILNVKNISDRPLRQVYVYYKNCDRNGFFGGITYRSLFGALESGQIVQNNQENYHPDSSVIVFVTYEEP